MYELNLIICMSNIFLIYFHKNFNFIISHFGKKIIFVPMKTSFLNVILDI